MKEVATALAKAQLRFGKALRNAEIGHLKRKYADLASCLEAVTVPLNEEGLALVQRVHDAEHGVCVETILYHMSGESLTFGNMFVPVTKNDAQGYGSALTYARRYGIMMLGIAPEDDDGEAAVKAMPKAEPKTEPKVVRKARTKEVLEGVLMAASNTEDLTLIWQGMDPDERNQVRELAAKRGEELKQLSGGQIE